MIPVGQCGRCGAKASILFRRLETGKLLLCPPCNWQQAERDGYQKNDKPGKPSGVRR